MRSFGLVALCLGLVACSGGCKEREVNAKTEAAPPPDAGPTIVKFDPKALERLGVRVGSPGHAGSDLRLHVPGTLEYNLERYAEIGTIVSGRVSQVFARVGDVVKKGQQLAIVLVPSIANAQAEYLSALARATETKAHAEREDKLLEKELTTLHEAQLARSATTQAQAELAASAARLTALGVPIPSGGGIVSGAGSLTLRSPIDGVVVRRDAVLGRFIEPTEKAFIVADPTSLWATLEVFESDVSYFHVGAEVDITIDALPGTAVKGTVALVEPQVGGASRALRARIAVPNPDGQLKPGYFVRAAVKLPELAAAPGKILVPSAAVQPLGDNDVVFVERGPGVFEVRNVRLGRRTTQVTEIVEGILPQERIVIEGGFLLRGEVTKQ